MRLYISIAILFVSWVAFGLHDAHGQSVGCSFLQVNWTTTMTLHPTKKMDGDDLYYRYWECGDGGSAGTSVVCDDTTDAGYCDEYLDAWAQWDWSGYSDDTVYSDDSGDYLWYDKGDDTWNAKTTNSRTLASWKVFAICKQD